MHKNLPYLFIFLDQYNREIFQNKNKNMGVIYRNYKSKKRDIELRKIAKACKESRIKLFVSNDVKLAIKFRADGLYIPSFNKTNSYCNLEKKMILLGSAHNQKEIQKKISQKCDAIFLSPAFHIKKKKKYLETHKFNFLANRNKINTFALGGISLKNINRLKLFNIDGFGAITLFKKKPAYKRPVFIKNNFF